jgi:hypothetical protein
MGAVILIRWFWGNNDPPDSSKANKKPNPINPVPHSGEPTNPGLLLGDSQVQNNTMTEEMPRNKQNGNGRRKMRPSVASSRMVFRRNPKNFF